MSKSFEMTRFNLTTKQWHLSSGDTVRKVKHIPPLSDECKREDNWTQALEWIALPVDYTEIAIYDFETDAWVKLSDIIPKGDCPEGATFLISLQPIQTSMVKIPPATCVEEESEKPPVTIAGSIVAMKEKSFYYAKAIVDADYDVEIFGEKIVRIGRTHRESSSANKAQNTPKPSEENKK